MMKKLVAIGIHMPQGRWVSASILAIVLIGVGALIAAGLAVLLVLPVSLLAEEPAAEEPSCYDLVSEDCASLSDADIIDMIEQDAHVEFPNSAKLLYSSSKTPRFLSKPWRYAVVTIPSLDAVKMDSRYVVSDEKMELGSDIQGVLEEAGFDSVARTFKIRGEGGKGIDGQYGTVWVTVAATDRPGKMLLIVTSWESGG